MDRDINEDLGLVIDPLALSPASLVSSPPWDRPSIRPTFYGAIPQFQETKPLAISDQFAIEQWTRYFPPVSDFNFVSLWSWNTDAGGGSIEVSWLNDNLVVLFKDYLSNNRFYSFLGTNEVDETVSTLLIAAQDQGLAPVLHLLPEVVIAELAADSPYASTLDESQSDYVLSLDEWSTLAGGKFRKKRHAIHLLERTYAPVCQPIDANDADVQAAMNAVFGRWAVQADRAGRDEAILQATALQRLFSLERLDDLLTFGVFIDHHLAAFTINEPVHDGYALGHFCYGDRTMPGLYPYVMRETCRALQAMGFRFLNIMQDLGQAGMTGAKQRNRPHHYLHKYSLTTASARVIEGDLLHQDQLIQLIVEPGG